MSKDGLAKRWKTAFLIILLSHFLMDAFSGAIPASLGLLQKRWGLTDGQGAWFLGLGSLCSGLAQPIFAWLSDRTGNRIFGGLGLMIVGLVLSSLGMAINAVFLFSFYAFGMIGNGMFHPIAASTIGQLNPVRRSFSVSCFFVAGMLGGITGSTFGPRILALENGFELFQLMIFPASAVALLLHWSIRSTEHRAAVTRNESTVEKIQQGQWSAVALLYCSAATRFLANLALVYLYVRWVEQVVAAQHPELDARQVARVAAPLAGNLNAFSFIGMAMGGLASGLLIKSGKEKTPYFFLPMCCAPVVAMLPHAGIPVAYPLAVIAGFGFATLVPVTIAMAQRFMPGRTSLASGLMMGGAWAVAMLGPTLAENLISWYGMNTAFAVVAVMMAISGWFVLPVSNRLISGSVD